MRSTPNISLAALFITLVLELGSSALLIRSTMKIVNLASLSMVTSTLGIALFVCGANLMLVCGVELKLGCACCGCLFVFCGVGKRGRLGVTVFLSAKVGAALFVLAEATLTSLIACAYVLFWVLQTVNVSFTSLYLGQPDQLALWSPLQFAHLTSVTVQSFLSWFPPHWVHFMSLPHVGALWPKP